MTGNTTTGLIPAAMMASLLASPAAANKLLNESWFEKASAGDIREAVAEGAGIHATHRSVGSRR